MNKRDDPKGRRLESAERLFTDEGAFDASVAEIRPRAEANLRSFDCYFVIRSGCTPKSIKPACHRRADELLVSKRPTDPLAETRLRESVHTFLTSLFHES